MSTKSLLSPVALAVLLGGAGCATYRARPLELEAVRAALAARPDEVARRLGPESTEAALELDGPATETAALLFNPGLRLARLEAGVAAAISDTSGLWSDPEFAFDLIRFVEFADEPWIIASTLSFSVPISGRLEAERARAEADLRRELTRVAGLEWALRMRTRRLRAELDAATRREEAILDHVERLARLSDSLRASEEAGQLGRAERRFLELDLARRRLEAARAAGRRERARLDLFAAIGFAADAPVSFLPGPDATPDAGPGEAEALALAEARRPGLRLARDRYEEREKALELEIRKQVPDFRIGGGAQSDEGRSGLILGFSIPIPILNANRQAIATAEAERRLAAEAFAAEYDLLVADLARAGQRRREAEACLELAEDSFRSLAEAQWTDAMRLVELGEFQPVFVVDSLDSRLESRLAAIDARLDLELAAIDREEAIGPEPGPVPPAPAEETP